MATKAATANGSTKADSNYLARIEEYLTRIKAIHKDIARERAQGRKVAAEIRRQQKEIQSILDRVEASL